MMQDIYSLYDITLELIAAMNKVIAKLLEVLAKKKTKKNEDEAKQIVDDFDVKKELLSITS